VRWRDRNFPPQRLDQGPLRQFCLLISPDRGTQRFSSTQIAKAWFMYYWHGEDHHSRLSWSDSSGKVICSGVITGGKELPFLINIASRGTHSATILSFGEHIHFVICSLSIEPIQYNCFRPLSLYHGPFRPKRMGFDPAAVGFRPNKRIGGSFRPTGLFDRAP
jgi:hypothetical protein